MLAEDLKGEGKYVAIDRDPNVKPYFESFRRRAGVKTRFLAGDFADVLERFADNGRGADASSSTSASRACSSTGRSVGFVVRGRRAARHEDGSHRGGFRARARQRGERARELTEIFRSYGEERYARQIAKRIARAARAAVRDDGRAGGDDQGCDPDAGAVRRRASGSARLPGAPDRGQRRARRARGSTAGSAGDACTGRPDRRDQLPLARGPDRQAVLPGGGARLHLPAGLPGLRVREGTLAPGPTRKAVSRPRRRSRRTRASARLRGVKT